MDGHQAFLLTLSATFPASGEHITQGMLLVLDGTDQLTVSEYSYNSPVPASRLPALDQDSAAATAPCPDGAGTGPQPRSPAFAARGPVIWGSRAPAFVHGDAHPAT